MARVLRQHVEVSSIHATTFKQPTRVESAEKVENDMHESIGDIAEAVGAKLSPKEKQECVHRMNRDAEQKRKLDLKNLINEHATAVLHNRLVVLPSADAVKNYMEMTMHGLVARTVVIDVTMPTSRQTGPKSRNVCFAPTADNQKVWATDLKVLPATPVVGHVLIRPAQHSVEALNYQISPQTVSAKISFFSPKNVLGGHFFYF